MAGLMGLTVKNNLAAKISNEDKSSQSRQSIRRTFVTDDVGVSRRQKQEPREKKIIAANPSSHGRDDVCIFRRRPVLCEGHRQSQA